MFLNENQSEVAVNKFARIQEYEIVIHDLLSNDAGQTERGAR